MEVFVQTDVIHAIAVIVKKEFTDISTQKKYNLFFPGNYNAGKGPVKKTTTIHFLPFKVSLLSK